MVDVIRRANAELLSLAMDLDEAPTDMEADAQAAPGADEFGEGRIWIAFMSTRWWRIIVRTWSV